MKKIYEFVTDKDLPKLTWLATAGIAYYLPHDYCIMFTKSLCCLIPISWAVSYNKIFKGHGTFGTMVTLLQLVYTLLLLIPVSVVYFIIKSLSNLDKKETAERQSSVKPETPKEPEPQPEVYRKTTKEPRQPEPKEEPELSPLMKSLLAEIEYCEKHYKNRVN